VDCEIYQTKAQVIEGLVEQLDKPVKFWQSL